jgi:hypothetical protein
VTQFVDLWIEELSGPALDWAVAKAEGLDVTFGQWGTFHYGAIIPQPVSCMPDQTVPYKPSTDWQKCGLLIEKHISGLCAPVDGYRELWMASYKNSVTPFYGGTAQIAVCRCIVAAIIGEVVQVPADLMTVGYVPVNAHFWSGGIRYQRIGTSSIMPVDEHGAVLPHALELDPSVPVQRIEA